MSAPPDPDRLPVVERGRLLALSPRVAVYVTPSASAVDACRLEWALRSVPQFVEGR